MSGLSGFALILAYIFAAYLVFLAPIVGTFQYRRLMTLLSVNPEFRAPFYRQLIFSQWILAAIAIYILSHARSPLAAIGLQVPAGWAWVLLFVALLAMVIAMVHAVLAAERSEDEERVRRMFEEASALLPHTSEERKLWAFVSVTAGVCEELIFRGFLLFYLAFVLPGVGSIVVILVSALIFGMAHSYQGVRGVLGTGLFGVGLATLFVLSGSIIPSMIVHALLDLRVLLIWKPKPDDITPETTEIEA